MKEFLKPGINWLIVFIPISFLINYIPPLKNDIALFVCSCLAMVVLSSLISTATEQLAAHVGSRIVLTLLYLPRKVLCIVSVQLLGSKGIWRFAVLKRIAIRSSIAVPLRPSNMRVLGAAFRGVSPHRLDLTFLVASRSREESDAMHLCLPLTRRGSNKENIAHILDPLRIETDDPVGTFSMNGPHFGDRYGIICDLLDALNTAGVDLMGLNCTIASITGVVPSSHLAKTIEAIRNCFDVPSILKTDREYE